MTLIVAISGRRSIWLLADRRLTLGNRVVKEDARKVMLLSTDDATAILGYAGLGATAARTEPSDWMCAVLRGYKRTFDQSLRTLTDAVTEQFPKHLKSLPKDYVASHHIVATSHFNGIARVDSIDLLMAQNRKEFCFRNTRHAGGGDAMRAPRVTLAGSGGIYIHKSHHRHMRPILSLINAYDDGRISGLMVADALASLNYTVHRELTALKDNSVGPRSVVVWRNNNKKVHKSMGGGHQYYTGVSREKQIPALPSIGLGVDYHALHNVLGPIFKRLGSEHRGGLPMRDLSDDEKTAVIDSMKRMPDKRLR